MKDHPTVYVVMHYWYEDSYIVDIFMEKEDAKKLIMTYSEEERFKYVIEELQVH